MEDKMEERKNAIIHNILGIEVDMFRRVPTGEEPSCRAHLDDMKLHRRGQFSAWSVETCESYLEDLKAAEERGENLMTIKYARMDNLIPPYSSNPLIDTIVDRYAEWQEKMIERYPNIMRGGRDMEDFRKYLRGELETYSDKTLDLLNKDMENCKETGRNMSVVVYDYLARQSGYKSIEEMENKLKK